MNKQVSGPYAEVGCLIASMKGLGHWSAGPPAHALFMAVV